MAHSFHFLKKKKKKPFLTEHSLWHVSSSATFHFHMTFTADLAQSKCRPVCPWPHIPLSGLDNSSAARLFFCSSAFTRLTPFQRCSGLVNFFCLFTVLFYKHSWYLSLMVKRFEIYCLEHFTELCSILVNNRCDVLMCGLFRVWVFILLNAFFSTKGLHSL